MTLHSSLFHVHVPYGRKPAGKRGFNRLVSGTGNGNPSLTERPFVTSSLLNLFVVPALYLKFGRAASLGAAETVGQG